MQRRRPFPVPSRQARPLTGRSASPTFGATMRRIRAPEGNGVLRDAIVSALRFAATSVPREVEGALHEARDREEGTAREELSAILENLEVARRQGAPLCQDTGVPAFHVRAGASSPHLPVLREAILGAVAEATRSVPLRPNAVHPLTGVNSGTNLGWGVPIVRWEVVDGDEVLITLSLKGGGSENQSAVRMLSPGAGLAGVKRAVVEHVISAGGAPCPPTVIGVGIGGGAAVALTLAEQALLRRLGERNADPALAALEEELLSLVNETGVGPMGLGGRTTALDVRVEAAFRHPASLPVGILLQCWAVRRAWVRLRAGGSIEVS